MYDIGSWTGGVCRDTAVGQYGGQIKSPQYKIGGYNTGPEFGSDRVADYAERYIIIPVCQKHAGIMRTVEKNAIRRDEDRKRKAASREVANERYQVNSERVTKGLAILDESHPNLGATKLPGTNGTMVKIDINALLGALGIKQAV